MKERLYEEFDDDWIDKHIDRCDRAGKQADARIDNILRSQFEHCDMHVHGTFLTALERIEALRRVPFREDVGGSGGFDS